MGQIDDEPMTNRQARYIQALGRELGLSAEELDARSEGEVGKAATALTRREAGTVIDVLAAEHSGMFVRKGRSW